MRLYYFQCFQTSQHHVTSYHRPSCVRHMCHLRVAKCESPVCHFRNTPSIHITGVVAWAIMGQELSSHYTRVLYATLTTQRSSISQASIHEAYYERSSISQASIHEAYILGDWCMNTPRYKSTLTHTPSYTPQSFDRGWSSCVPRRTQVCDCTHSYVWQDTYACECIAHSYTYALTNALTQQSEPLRYHLQPPLPTRHPNAVVDVDVDGKCGMATMRWLPECLSLFWKRALFAHVFYAAGHIYVYIHV